MTRGIEQDNRYAAGPLVCSTDFSIHAEEAADVATWIAQKSRQMIHLVHVLEPGVSSSDFPQVEASAMARLVTAAERARQSQVVVEERLLAGEVVPTINKYAREASAALIVMSSLGSIAPSLLVTASDAEGIAESAPCPTLVVHNETNLHPALRGERPLNVLAGYDFSKTADSALRWIRWIRTVTSCNVEVVFANTAEADSGSTEESLTRKAEAVLGKGMATCRVVASETDAGTALADVAAGRKPDILVVGTHQRHGLKRLWLGSVSRKVLREAATNVAVIPALED